MFLYCSLVGATVDLLSAQRSARSGHCHHSHHGIAPAFVLIFDQNLTIRDLDGTWIVLQSAVVGIADGGPLAVVRDAHDGESLRSLNGWYIASWRLGSVAVRISLTRSCRHDARILRQHVPQRPWLQMQIRFKDLQEACGCVEQYRRDQLTSNPGLLP